MIRKRTRPQPQLRQRLPSIEREVGDNEGEGQDSEEKLDLADLIELRKLRRTREGIDATKLTKGDVKKKRKRPKEEEDKGGLKKGADMSGGVASTAGGAGGTGGDEDEEDEEDKDAKARRVVRTNNFTQQTNVLDVDKHMMAYIEENMKLRRGTKDEVDKEKGPADPYAELFRMTGKHDNSEKEEGNVTNSLAMLTAIPEVDLGMDTRLKNIEDTEKAKRQVAEEKKERRKAGNDEEHLAAARFYRPNLKMKTDAEIMRDAKLEAMGLPPEEYQPRHTERTQMATDEMVMERFKKRMRK